MQMNILIVEDHEAVRKSLVEWLRWVFPQCHFTEAVSGEEAIEICRTGIPDLILMDISLPGLNGIGTTKRILSMLPAVRVIMLTIHEEEVYRTESMSAGASVFIPKRMMKIELIPAIEKLLGINSPKEKGLAQKIGQSAQNFRQIKGKEKCSEWVTDRN